MKEYALYKGNDILAIGTIKEIAEKMGCKEDTIKYYYFPSYVKRAKKDNNQRRVLIALDD